VTTPKWFEPRVTLGNILSLIAMLATVVGGYVALKIDVSDAKQSIAALQQTVQPLPSMETRLTVVESTISTKGAARDKQMADLTARVDLNQNSVDAKLDKLIDGMTVLSNQVAALTAVARAQERQP
jgi:phage shock protein A